MKYLIPALLLRAGLLGRKIEVESRETFLDLIRENLFLRRLALAGCFALGVSLGLLGWALVFRSPEVFIVRPDGQVEIVRDGESIPQAFEVDDFARSAIRFAYEIEPWGREKALAQAGEFCSEQFLKKMESENSPAGIFGPSVPGAYRKLAVKELEVEEGSGQGELRLKVEGTRISGNLLSEEIKREPVRLVLMLKKAPRTKENPHGLWLEDFSDSR